jgi:hypothetical protein
VQTSERTRCARIANELLHTSLYLCVPADIFEGARVERFVRFCCVVLLTGCNRAPELAPPSAQIPIESSALALRDLFDAECVQQRNLHWARAESERIVATCGGLLVGTGEKGDCEQELEAHVAWEVPARPKSNVLVEMSWNSGIFNCSISVQPELATNLELAAYGITVPHRFSRRLFYDGEEALRSDTQGQWAGRFDALARKHPYALENHR